MIWKELSGSHAEERVEVGRQEARAPLVELF